MKYVGDTAVMVMRGSYSYIGADGEDYVVNWYDNKHSLTIIQGKRLGQLIIFAINFAIS